MDERDKAAEAIDDIASDAKAEGESEARWQALDSRFAALESRLDARSEPQSVDLRPLEASIASLGSRLDELASKSQQPVATETETETKAEPVDDDDDDEIPPQIDIKAASRGAVKPERAPKPKHFLFRSFGRKRY